MTNEARVSTLIAKIDVIVDALYKTQDASCNDLFSFRGVSLRVLRKANAGDLRVNGYNVNGQVAATIRAIEAARSLSALKSALNSLRDVLTFATGGAVYA